ncbi:DUF2169 family type VI secretion system accessory protein [Cystobacter ferrugineus]|uniref:DUF2169 domain-containing protein n=1 Tax=Cystobacter ferrugineus TaxID=83449 RepID=A0A1L9BJD5_9BACT|nr:DUF2169 domain-containing protein [Cystobacter ferrugineus]OJH42367.1 hypothetical protein BON30_03955 [Cystobacter ferrugineus]
MWDLENQTRYEAQRAFVRDRDGSEIWLVVVRGTFDISAEGECSIAQEQEPVALVPQYLGKPGHSLLRCDTDMVRTKPGTDVLVNGWAYAPLGRPTTEVSVSLTVGPIRKTLTVTGDRHWRRGLSGLTPSLPTPFLKLPVTYERAYGGPSLEGIHGGPMNGPDQNPLGVGLNVTEGACLPNIEYRDAPLDRGERRARPAGLGAIACSWMPRRKLAGTYDETWQRERQPLVSSDFHDEYFYSAPEDQRVPGHLRGGEHVELTNLSPSGRLGFRLPRVSLGFRTLMGNRLVHHRALLHTVLIEPEISRLVMSWHTALPCHHDLYSLQRTIVFEKAHLTYDSRSPHESSRS